MCGTYKMRPNLSTIWLCYQIISNNIQNHQWVFALLNLAILILQLKLQCEYSNKSQVRVSRIIPARHAIKTQSSLDEDTQAEYLNIGYEIRSLGRLKAEVQQVLDQCGFYPATMILDDPAHNHLFTFHQYPDCSVFYGQMRHGMRHGIGRQHWINEGNYLEGTWVEDKAHGPARMIYPNGDIFEGQLVDNKANGYGTFRNKKKEVQGYWVDNRLQGEGVEVRKNGVRYEGSFQNGVIEGRGTFTFPEGRKYTGQVHQGQIHGSGLMSWSDCSYYKGDFRFNQLKGRGCYTDIDGKVYKGHFISIYHPDESQLEILYTDDENIQDCDKLKRFKKQYKLN